jgi:hypothetical protein
MKAQDVLGITGDMASVMGKDLMQAVEAVADAQTGELERLKEFGITKGMLEEQAKIMGKTPFDKKGSLKDQEALNDALFAIMEKRFKGGMEMQSTTFKGMLSNVSDFVGTMGRELGKPLFEKAKVGLQDFLGFLNRLKDSGAVGRFVNGVTIAGGLIASVFGHAADIIGAVLGPVISPIIDGFVWLGKAAGSLYEMLFVSGEAPFLQKYFSPDTLNNINNFFWDIYDAGVAFKGFFVNTLGPAISGAVTKIKETVGGMATYFIENFGKFEPYIVGITAAFTAYFVALQLINTWTRVVAAAQAIWNAVMAINPIVLIVLAIGLLVGWLIHLAGGWDVVRQKLAVLWQYMITAWSSISAWLMPFIQIMIQNIIQWFNNIWLAVQPLLTTIWTGIMNVFNSIKAFWDQWGGLISALFQVWWAYVSSIFMSAVSILWTIVKGAFEYISNIVSGIFKIISGIIQVAWAVITGLFSTALALLTGDWEGAWNNMLDMLSGVWSGVQDFFSGLKDLFFDSGAAIMKTLAEGIKSMASAPFEAVGSALKKVRELLPFSDAKTGPLSSLTHNGGKIVSTMAEGVYQQAGTLHKAMSDTLDDTPTSTTVNANKHRINAAGSGTGTGTGDRRTQIKNLIEKLVIQGVDKDGKTIADEVIEAIYEKLTQAEDILSAGDWGDLLND